MVSSGQRVLMKALRIPVVLSINIVSSYVVYAALRYFHFDVTYFNVLDLALTLDILLCWSSVKSESIRAKWALKDSLYREKVGAPKSTQVLRRPTINNRTTEKI